MGDNAENILDNYFKEFKVKMNKRSRILISLVKKFEMDICFLVNTNRTMIKLIKLRIKCLAPMGYEMDHDFSLKSIKALLALSKDKKAKRFGTFEEAKSRIKIGLVIGKLMRKEMKMKKVLTKHFGDVSDSSKESSVEPPTEGQLMLVDKPYGSEEVESETRI